MGRKARDDRPGLDADSDLLPATILLLSVEGVACIEIYLDLPILLPFTMCAGSDHRLASGARRSKPGFVDGAIAAAAFNEVQKPQSAGG